MNVSQADNLTFVLTVAGLVGALLVAFGIVFATLYRRASKEMAFVRTGLGGERVVKDGGAIVLPVLHEVIRVNMNTLRIEVEKRQKDALITKDRMRVDVKADFYLRVAPSKEGIAMAAQTLGRRTTKADEVKVLMESKFVDVLRAVAAEMSMTEMHEQRSSFVQKVQQAVANDLEKNGLELESVSLTGFDQTDLAYFNENNAFDAEGRARLAKIIEEKRKETNDIEQENRILIEQRNLEADKQSLEIAKHQEEARLSQEQVLAFRRAEQRAEIAKQREQREREEREAEIEKQRALETAELDKQREVKSRQLVHQKAMEEARILKDKELEVAEQEKKIAVAVKSEEESAARAQAAEAEKLRVEKEEAVVTTRDVAEAERRARIEVIDGKKDAERLAVRVLVEAEADRQAAEDRAKAVLTEARAEADAKVMRAEADERVLSVEAEGKRAINEAENALRDEHIELRRALAILQVLPEVVASAVKPLENIEGIKILQGFGAAGHAPGLGSESSGGGLAEQVTQAALRYRANAPVVDALLREVGLVNREEGTLDELVTGHPYLSGNGIASTETSAPIQGGSSGQ